MENEIKSDGVILGKFTGSTMHPRENEAVTVLGIKLGEDGAPFLIGFSNRHAKTLLEWNSGDEIEMILRRKGEGNGK